MRSVALSVAVGLSLLPWATLAARQDDDRPTGRTAAVQETAPAGDKDVSGAWRWKASGSNGVEEELTLTLKQEGEKVTGTFITSRPGGPMIDVKDGEFKEGKLAFALRRSANGVDWATWYRGKVKGDTITGRIEVERDGEVQRTFDWEAKRSPKEKKSDPGELSTKFGARGR